MNARPAVARAGPFEFSGQPPGGRLPMSPIPLERRSDGRVGCLVALATLLLLTATGPRLAIVWDEGYTLGREARLRLWFRALADPTSFAASWQPPAEELVQQVGAPPPRPEQVNTRAKLLFDPNVLAWFWPFAREEPHGHPPFYALIGLVGDVLPSGISGLPRARFGPMVVFSLMAATLYAFTARRLGVWPGAAAAGAWVLQPNLFAHGHYATYDAVLSALWLGGVLAFALAVEDRDGLGAKARRPNWRWVVAFGLLLGAAADTKLTGWFLPVPLLTWAAIYGSRRGFLTVLVGGMIAVAVLYAMNPPWWTEPLAGPARFFASNLGRDETIRIKTLFLGQVVSTPDGSLPWYNTLVWTVFVTPVGLLLLALVGVGRALARRRVEPLGLLIAGNWAFFLLLRALPHTPGHDGVRQFLPAFGLLAVSSGLGAASVVARLPRWGRVLVAAALAEAAAGVALSMPVPLSYYSPIVGGLPGASALGMEPTFYWDALTEDALAWLRSHTRPGQKVMFASYPSNWLYLRDTGMLPAGFLPNDPGVWTWYVVQNRPGSFKPLDRALAARGKPAFVVSKFGVPLLWVFPFDQVEALLRPGASKRNTAPQAINLGAALASFGGHEVMTDASSRVGVNLLARGESLGRALRGGVDRGRFVADRGRVIGRGRADDRGLLVAEAAEGHLLVAALEQAALLLRGRGIDDRLADRRGRGRAGRDYDGGRGGTRDRGGTLLLLVASLDVGRGESAEQAGEGQRQQIASHDVHSESKSNDGNFTTRKYRILARLGNLHTLLKV